MTGQDIMEFWRRCANYCSENHDFHDSIAESIAEEMGLVFSDAQIQEISINILLRHGRVPGED